MRRILTGCLTAGIGWAAVAQAQDPAWTCGSINPMRQPAVTLGPPAVSLGAPRVMSTSGRGEIAPCAFGIVARGAADDKAPMPPGPALPSGPSSSLPAPTPLAAPELGPGAIVGGPVVGEVSPAGPLPGQPCPTCAPDASWGPLPGGVFAADARPCGYIFYGSAEALFMWIKSSQLPPLLTISPATVTGAVAPGTRVIFGGQDIAPNERIGGRFTIGWWLNECQNWGVVGSYFFLGQRGMSFAATGDGVNVLSRPFLNTNPVVGGSATNPVADREIIAFPGLATGAFVASTSNELWGADINARMNLFRGCRWRVDGLLGFRYLQFDEQLNIGETFAGTAGPNAGRTGMLMDNFNVTNNFYGGQLGLVGELRRGPWTLDVIGKVALGTTHESLTANGAQVGFDPRLGTVTGAGLLVQPSNAGTHSHDVFAVVPEVNLNVGYQITPHMKVFAGYDFLCWSRVARVADQVDTTLDVNSRTFPITQPAGAMRPAATFHETSLWAQGFNVGLQFTW